MGKVIGIGGVFFKSANPEATRDWYAQVLGISFQDWGGTIFEPRDAAAKAGAATVFCPFDADTDYFAPSDAPFMINLMVDDLASVLARCAENGVEPASTTMSEPNGDFAHVMDPEGRKIELWQPKPM